MDIKVLQPGDPPALALAFSLLGLGLRAGRLAI